MEFYESVFGWKASDASRTMPYTEWLLDGRQIGVLFTLGSDMPAEVPSHWATYFCVADLEAALGKVKQLGGDLLMGPMDIDPGRMAIVRDDQGASFDIVELREFPIKLP